MKKTLSLLLGGTLLVLAQSGCMQMKPMDDATITAKADSMYNARKSSIMDSMNKDCQANMATWVKMKADSICKADSMAMPMSMK